MPVVQGAASAITSKRVAAYGALSTLAAVAVVVSAFRQRSNFYAATVMLGGSNGCMMVLLNFAFFLALCIGRIGQKILFGDLRAVEVEHLHERLWYAITESLLAMTIFRDDFDASFAILFVTLLFLKVFHWLSADRVEYMEQSPSVGRVFHLRMITVLSMLFEFDLFLATFAVEVLIVDQHRKGIMIMFSSEFFILGATLWSTIAKYLINCQDMRSEEPWQNKSMYVFFVDLVTDFLKLATYLACFCLILSYYGLPLNIIRDVYMTGRSFFGRLRDFIQYRAATRNMDTRFPDATSADLRNSSDRTCIICREEMIARDDGEENDEAAGVAGSDPSQAQRPAPQPSAPSSGLNETPKKLPCGHIFHFHCLRSWLERQQSCPTCRRTVFALAPGFERGPAAAAAPPNGAQQDAGQRRHGHGGPGGAAAAEVPRRGSAAAGEGRERENPTLTARERLQSFLSQLQTDSQRLRDEHRQRTVPNQQPAHGQEDVASASTAPPASASSDAPGGSASGTGPPNAPEMARSLAKQVLVNSLFAQRDTATRRHDTGEGPSTSALPPSPITQGLTPVRSVRTDELHPSWIPPAPWTMRSRSRDSDTGSPAPRDGSGQATKAASVTPEADSLASSLAPKETTEAEAAPDPADAREAARAAALRRFDAQRTKSSSNVRSEAAASKASDTPTTAATSVKGKSTTVDEEQVRQPIPGNPHLIPLFDAATIEDFDKSHADQLPYPLLRRAPELANPNVARRSAPVDLSPLVLSPADLEGLSKQTRSGLEERLRLLYRVEEAVGGLVEELTRALSVLPVDDAIMQASTDDDAQPQPGGETAGAHVKGKAPAEGLRAGLPPL